MALPDSQPSTTSSALAAGAGASAAKPKTSGVITAKGLADNIDTFLQLLTTQLRNQNPLEPMDMNQFTQQLVQFGQIEQQLKTNETLMELVKISETSQLTNALGFVGTTVTADGATTLLDQGKAQWKVRADEPVQNVTLTIKDGDGNVVWEENGSLPAGEETLDWDGRTLDGRFAAPGFYTITVQGTDATGRNIPVKTEITGKVDGVDLSTGDPVLRIGPLNVPMRAVKSFGVSVPPAQA